MTGPAAHVLAYDVGTTATKACLYRVGETLELVDAATAEYPLRVLDGGGVEQDAEDWWRAAASTTRALLARAAPWTGRRARAGVLRPDAGAGAGGPGRARWCAHR